jgi:hypothetical protein
MIYEDRCLAQRIEHHRTPLSRNWMLVRTSRFSIAPDDRNNDATRGNAANGEGADESFWLRLQCEFQPNQKRNDVEIESTEVVLAFRFKAAAKTTSDSKLAGNHSNAKPHTQTQTLELASSDGLMPVYAFLPTKIRFFNFVIQGDFVASNNREQVQHTTDSSN